jgi:hypothetical protein
MPRKRSAEKTQAQLEYERIMAHRRSAPERTNNRDYGTNWRPDGLAPKVKRDHMLGEGIGNCLGLDDPKHTRNYCSGEFEAIEEADQIYVAELRFKQSLQRRRNAVIKQRFQASLPEKVQAGKILVQQRIFMAYPNPNWDARAERMGGIPEGVDVAKSAFGHLLLVPVIEAKKSRFKDPYGLSFQIDPVVRDTVQKIFGAVKWTRPLTLDEVKQFGVEVE